MLLAFHFLELQRAGRNIHDQVNPGGVARNVKERSLHVCANVAGHFTGHPALQIFFDGTPLERVLRLDLAIAAAGTDDGTAAFHFHLQRMAASLRRIGRGVADDVVLRLILCDLLQSRKQVVGVEDDESSSAIGQLI